MVAALRSVTRTWRSREQLFAAYARSLQMLRIYWAYREVAQFRFGIAVGLIIVFSVSLHSGKVVEGDAWKLKGRKRKA